ncbi:hypothetical protein VP01_2975g1 [Puccinia sorghi]|uniref:Uncharacterized protein n=1 Tax=Puccinia sorghi TaxID=27349 RepID=A0A0L6V0P9_9BASI|nr:hypothetical protein VP01_2975g1 [Puccinia sorghi]
MAVMGEVRPGSNTTPVISLDNLELILSEAEFGSAPNKAEEMTLEELGATPQSIYNGTTGKHMLTLEYLQMMLPGDPWLMKQYTPSAVADPTASPNLPGIFRPPIFSEASQSTHIPSFDTVDIGSNGSSSSAKTYNLLVSALVAASSHTCFIMLWMSEFLKRVQDQFHELSSLQGQVTSKAIYLKKSAITSWVIMVLVALCHDPNTGNNVTSACAFVLSGCERTIQDTTFSKDSVDTRYSQLYALPSASPNSKAQIQIAKITLEKNYAAFLLGHMLPILWIHLGALNVFLACVELSPAYLLCHWWTMTCLLGPVVLAGWFVGSALIFALLPALLYLEALVIAACVCPTNMVLISSVIIKGHYSQEHVLSHVQEQGHVYHQCSCYPSFSLIQALVEVMSTRAYVALTPAALASSQANIVLASSKVASSNLDEGLRNPMHQLWGLY